MVKGVRSFSIYTSNVRGMDEQLNPLLEETFRQMCSIDEENQDKQVGNMRLKKYILKKFLAKRYPPRICNKFCTLF